MRATSHLSQSAVFVTNLLRSKPVRRMELGQAVSRRMLPAYRRDGSSRPFSRVQFLALCGGSTTTSRFSLHFVSGNSQMLSAFVDGCHLFPLACSKRTPPALSKARLSKIQPITSEA